MVFRISATKIVSIFFALYFTFLGAESLSSKEMTPYQRIALVTGGNKGIGYEVARKLGDPANNIKTIIGCRSSELGTKAAETLRAAGCNVVFRELDISNLSSINKLRSSIEEEFGHLDILVNNAAIAFKGSDPTPFIQQADPTITVNFFGTLDVTDAMLPLLRKSEAARIVNVASMAGHLRIIPSEKRKAQFTSPQLQVGELKSLMHEFVTDVEGGVHTGKGWPNTCYGMSKLGVIALTKVLARDENMMVNACCPGYCDTDMTSGRGPRTAEHGARTPAMLALLPNTPLVTGKFYSDEAEEAW